MQVGPYHPVRCCDGSGVWSLRILDSIEDLFVGVSSLPAVVHFPPDAQDLLHPFSMVVSTLAHQLGELLELGEVALFLRGEKPELLEERDTVLVDSSEVVHLVVPAACH